MYNIMIVGNADITYLKVKRIDPMSSHCKKGSIFFPFILYLWNDGCFWIYCGNHFTIYVSQITILYFLNLYSVAYQLYLSKDKKMKISILKSLSLYLLKNKIH